MSTQGNSTNTINQKSDSCDKLLCSFVDGSNQENKRPIIRVNLIKKSNKPALLSSVNRKLLLSRPGFQKNTQQQQPTTSPCSEATVEEVSCQTKDNRSFNDKKASIKSNANIAKEAAEDEVNTKNLKASVQTKLQKAATKRKEQLDKIVRKAHDEDSKVSEIQFINNLEAQNRRHDMNNRKKECEARLRDLQDERQRRFEEKLAKEAAAEERRKTLEAERKAKLLEIQQRRRIKNQKVEQQQQVKEKKRIERNRNRERKITAIKEAYNAGVQTLRSRIHEKQEQSERRHKVNLRLIRQKAFELSIKRYNSFVSETRAKASNKASESNAINKQKETSTNDTKRLQLKPFNTKKFCNLCKDTISSESALFSHLRSEAHLSSINDHYGDAMLTTNEAVEIHNLRHIVETDEPIDSDKGTNGSDDQQSSRASSLVNYYHSSYLNQVNAGISMSEGDRESLLAIEKKCRKLRHKLIAAGKPFNRDWLVGKVRDRLAKLIIQQRIARNQTTNTDPSSVANLIDLSPNNPNCQQNKPLYLKINRICRELINVTTDQRISGGGLLPASIVHSVDRLMADLNKQLCCRKPSQLSYHAFQDISEKEMDANQLAIVTKMIEFHAIDTLFLYDVVSCLVTILRKMVPNVSLTSKLPSTVASHYSTLIDPISLNSYYCHKSPILPARIYIKMIRLLQQLCMKHSDLCYGIFQSNNLINLSDILSYRLGFIIGNESPASSISGSSSAATLSAQTVDRKVAKQQHHNSSTSSDSSYIASTRKSSTNTTSKNKSFQKRGSDFERQRQRQSNDGREKDAGGSSKSSMVNLISKQPDDNGYVGDEEEGDFWEQAETYKRTEEVVDDMTAGLCKLLATVTDTILTRPLTLIDQLDKMAFDQRSDDFITYMVSVGIVDTESVIMSYIHQQQHQNQRNQQTLSTSNTNINCISNSSGGGGGNNNNNSTASLSTFGVAPDKSIASTMLDSTIGAQAMSGNSASTIGQNTSSVATNSSNSITSATAYTNKYPGLVSSPSTTMTTSTTSTSASASTSSKVLNFTTSCIEFATSLVKLVTAKLSADDNDVEPKGNSLDYQQQDSTQLLETLKMTQLSGVLTLVYDMLVHSFNSLTDAGVTNSSSLNVALAVASQNHQSTNSNHNNSLARQLNLALHSLKLINYVAYIDIKFVQSTLKADEMLPLQLRHVCSYLIKYLVQSQFKIVDYMQQQQQQQKQQQNLQKTSDLTYALSNNHNYLISDLELDFLKNELMNEIILLVGNFAYLDQDNQLLLKSGRQPSIIEQFISLPFDYFSRENLKLVLMPSLISCAYLNDEICSIICSDLSMSLFTAFIEDQLLRAQTCDNKNGRDKRKKSSLVNYELNSSNLASNRWQFDKRFAKSKWLGAKNYFEAQREKMR